MQYLYWEKVQPPRVGQTLQTPYFDMIPLMRNWTKFTANARDEYEALHGRARAKVNPFWVWSVSVSCLYHLLFATYTCLQL